MLLRLSVFVAVSFAATSISTSSVLPLRRRAQQPRVIPITSTQYGTNFNVEVQFGNQTFQLVLDTGSSDTWVIQTGFQCYNATDNTEVPPDVCNYGNASYNISSTFEQIDDEYFGVYYGAGPVTGFTGYEEVTLGGIKVKRQQVGIVDESSLNQGDGVNSGLVGFGYPSLTAAHVGKTSVSNGSSLLSNRTTYNPLFTNMYEQGLVDPYFSLALERTLYNDSIAPAGYLALGSLPPVAHNSNFSIVPVEIPRTIPLSYTNGTSVRTYWTTTISRAIWGTNSSNLHANLTSFQIIIDSGNPWNTFPPELAEAVNGAFDPPAVIDKSLGAWSVNCNATAPMLGVEIGNQTFYHRGQDLIIPLGDGTCMTSIIATVPVSGIVLNVLGDAFLKNVVAVFDFGKDEMRFAARVDFSNTTIGPSPPEPYTGAASRQGIPIGNVLRTMAIVAAMIIV